MVLGFKTYLTRAGVERGPATGEFMGHGAGLGERDPWDVPGFHGDGQRGRWLVFVAALGMHVTENPSLSCDSSPNPAVPAGPRCTILPHPGCPQGDKEARDEEGWVVLCAVSLWVPVWVEVVCPRRIWGAGSKEWVLQDCAFGVV